MSIIKNLKERKQVIKKANKEAEKIFVKKKTNAMADGSFPKINSSNADTAYGKEERRNRKQVVTYRLKQMKANRKLK
jgi:hypothetical protein